MPIIIVKNITKTLIVSKQAYNGCTNLVTKVTALNKAIVAQNSSCKKGLSPHQSLVKNNVNKKCKQKM